MMLDISWVTDRLAVGGGLSVPGTLEALRHSGITHIINTQAEFDDRTVLSGSDGEEHTPKVLWLATDDDLEPKPPDYFRPGVRFALEAFSQPTAKLLVHCASGIHRGPMVALAILCVLGYGRHEAVRLLRARRPQVDFPEVYLNSVEAFLAEWQNDEEVSLPPTAS